MHVSIGRFERREKVSNACLLVWPEWSVLGFKDQGGGQSGREQP